MTIFHCEGIGPDEWFYQFVVFLAGSCPGDRGLGGNSLALVLSGEVVGVLPYFGKRKQSSDKSDISCKRAKLVCHFHWGQWNIMMYYLTCIS